LLIALLSYLYRFQGSSHSLSQALDNNITTITICQAYFQKNFNFFFIFCALCTYGSHLTVFRMKSCLFILY